jgi:hypothetical protein
VYLDQKKVLGHEGRGWGIISPRPASTLMRLFPFHKGINIMFPCYNPSLHSNQIVSAERE